MNNTKNSGHSGARSLAVWDPLVRLIHWSLAITILLNALIVDEDSKFHLWIGYVAVGLVAVRLVWGVVGTKYAKFSAFPPNPVASFQQLTVFFRRDDPVHISHNPLGALMVYNIWATVIIIAVTGYAMGTTQFFGVEWMEDAHEMAFIWLLVSIVLHVGGVVFDTWRSGVPLVRAMIDGRKRIPQNRQVK